eukprot:m.180048 g.180048  ORF g.180048 m.180048 type:complete len:320 (+) comp16849_c0_seq2:958-1917(+)
MYAARIQLEDDDAILDLDQRHAQLTSAILTRLNARDHMLGSFLAGLLDPNPMLRLTPMEALAHPFLADFATPTSTHPPAWRPSRRADWRHKPHDPLQLRKRWNLRWVPDESPPTADGPVRSEVDVPVRSEVPVRSVRLNSRTGSVHLNQLEEMSASRRLSNSNGQGFVTIKREPAEIDQSSTSLLPPFSKAHPPPSPVATVVILSPDSELTVHQVAPLDHADSVSSPTPVVPQTVSTTTSNRRQPSASAHTARRPPKRSKRMQTSRAAKPPEPRGRRIRKPRLSDDVRYSAQRVLNKSMSPSLDDPGSALPEDPLLESD